jgi:hypothetical protein
MGIKANKENRIDGGILLQKATHFPDGDTRGALQGKSVDAGADGRESHAVDPVFDGELERSPVTVRQQLILKIVAAAPHRPDSMDNPPRREAITTSNFSLARRTAVQGTAYRQEFRPRCSMNRAIHSPAAQQRRIGRVHNCVHVLRRDIAPHNRDGLMLHVPTRENR